jgi:hypothetical protein
MVLLLALLELEGLERGALEQRLAAYEARLAEQAARPSPHTALRPADDGALLASPRLERARRGSSRRPQRRPSTR